MIKLINTNFIRSVFEKDLPYCMHIVFCDSRGRTDAAVEQRLQIKENEVYNKFKKAFKHGREIEYVYSSFCFIPVCYNYSKKEELCVNMMRRFFSVIQQIKKKSLNIRYNKYNYPNVGVALCNRLKEDENITLYVTNN